MKFSRNAPPTRRCVRREDSYFVANNIENMRLTQRQFAQVGEPAHTTGSPTVILFLLYK
ncbi:hypothetical protein HCG51_01270 [Tolypothrix sp. PCC 7910]|uniref:hypothetical protein n=1 Tax=Tolypothrix sp. PCC 7910 TaxID=2099387 RepID=UPI0014277D41|nr:hypothetical protein [Tolypothrix sp. PCC 7910]QIR35514.1 hypothetical protein HCG51_01270 [Tolypothrix sp. PCC 7910]